MHTFALNCVVYLTYFISFLIEREHSQKCFEATDPICMTSRGKEWIKAEINFSVDNRSEELPRMGQAQDRSTRHTHWNRNAWNDASWNGCLEIKSKTDKGHAADKNGSTHSEHSAHCGNRDHIPLGLVFTALHSCVSSGGSGPCLIQLCKPSALGKSPGT